MKVDASLHDELINVFSYDDSEKGGLVFFRENKVVAYYLDKKGERNKKYYRPDINALKEGVMLCAKEKYTEFAFIHSHPPSEMISGADIAWIRSFLYLNDLDEIKLFLVVDNSMLIYLISENRCTLIPLHIDKDEVL